MGPNSVGSRQSGLLDAADRPGVNCKDAVITWCGRVYTQSLCRRMRRAHRSSILGGETRSDEDLDGRDGPVNYGGDSANERDDAGADVVAKGGEVCVDKSCDWR